ncbi:alpha/beta hydrolase [Aquimarina sp. ERC-38]|uniref:alpha/beta hydrolase n=1 Tax=Aquimarina sp. ERC-38 TaxID=2949996 RepID=UPI00224818AE|nr:alpha/beta hydrolase [Aquimarina sp. ERC-38]UZO79816.1 alpha/beta hydrolase [Aquimarina sp. ERC-38]
MKNSKIPVQSLLIPKRLVKLGKLLERISPFLATRFAARLFLTPFKYKRPKREEKMYSKSKKELIAVPKINQQIKVYQYGNLQRGKKALLVHGWSGTGTQLAKIADVLVKEGYGVVSFDAPAHGEAPGKISMMPFFIESIHQLQKQYGPFDIAIGHSLGGMSLLKAGGEDLTLRKLVIIGTADSITEITNDFAKNMQLQYSTGVRMKKYFDRKFGEDLNNYSGAVSATKVSIPTLVIHDKDDVDVSYEAATSIHAALTNSQLILTERLGHRKILGNPSVIDAILNFIKEEETVKVNTV